MNAELAGQVALVGKEYAYDDREAVDCQCCEANQPGCCVMGSGLCDYGWSWALELRSGGQFLMEGTCAKFLSLITGIVFVSALRSTSHFGFLSCHFYLLSYFDPSSSTIFIAGQGLPEKTGWNSGIKWELVRRWQFLQRIRSVKAFQLMESGPARVGD